MPEITIPKMNRLAKNILHSVKKKADAGITPSSHKIANTFRILADEARDSGKYLAAAELYRQVLELRPPTVDLLLICGHMYKEGRDFPTAEKYYKRALEISPHNKEILMQLGHFYKTTGNYKEAEKYYQDTIVADPDWAHAREELDNMRRSDEYRRFYKGGRTHDGRVSQILVRKTRDELYHDHTNAFVITRGGNHQITRWGSGQTLRGIDSLRGYLVTDQTYTTLEISLDGRLIFAGDLQLAPLRREKSNPNMRKYVYNAWVDVSDIPCGAYDMLLVAKGPYAEPRQGENWRRERVIVAEPLPEDVVEKSAAYVPAKAVHALLEKPDVIETDSVNDAPRPEYVAIGMAFDAATVARVRAESLKLIDAINAMPSVVFKADKSTFPGPIRNVAVLRTDQLGDLASSVPALQRLREILPDANLVGLVTSANKDLAKTLNIFNELVVIEFPDDPVQQDRVMNKAKQAELINRLKPYNFDVAIDFAISGLSRKLLPLTGAPTTLGFDTGGNTTLDLSAAAHDPKAGYHIMRHSSQVQLLSEALGFWLNGPATVVKRKDISRANLVPYGIGEDEDYVVLHSGSRLAMIRWPEYPALCQKMLEAGKKVVYFADDDKDREKLPKDKIEDGSIIYMARKMPFQDFDAILSYSSLFIGNDSGPKHLASLRGAKVLSIHPGRSDWREWGQELTGAIITRRLPCTGCSLHADPEECAHDIACVRKITVEEVFQEATALLQEK